mmetsp:Transcript_6167/g.7246  ORF Transcript_6167/g.7246 Transcript_6167/m.7246 type:complete len:90 (-) Transcript_6167:62-331(-)
MKYVSSCFKPNKLQLLGVLGHLQLAGVTNSLTRFDSMATLNDDLRSSTSSLIKQRFIQAGGNKGARKGGPQDRKSKPVLTCNSCLILTV